MLNWANPFLHFGFLPFPFLLFIFNNFLQPLAATNSTTTNCSLETNSTVRVLVLFDISPSNEAFFRDQQIWTEKILRHIDSRIEKNRPRRYGLIAFHRLAIVLTDLNAPQTSDLSRLLDQIHSLKPRSRLETSPAKALDMASQLIDANDKNDGEDGEEKPTMLFLVHDGRNTDMIAETLEASKKLAKNGVAKFALAIGQTRNEQILVGYTGKSEKMLTTPTEHRDQFFAEINKEIDGDCGDLQNGSKEEEKLAEEIQQLEENENKSNETLRKNNNLPKETSMVELCGNGEEKVDLMLLLDTSGSVFHSFSQQRQLATDLLASLNNQNDQSLHVGLISFAAEPSTVLSLGEAVEKQKMLARIEAIKFSGGDNIKYSFFEVSKKWLSEFISRIDGKRNTRIADAVELSLEEIQKYGREKAIKVLVLISDGHGDEFWARAQAVGHRLQQTSKLNIFAVSASPDFNRPELALYVGNEERIFVGQRHRSFVLKISSILNKCLERTKIEEKGKDREIRELLANSNSDGRKMEILINSGELAENGSSKIEGRKQRDQPIIGEDSGEEEENGGRKHSIQKVAIHQQDSSRRLPADCPTDILFLLDRFSPDGTFSPIFERQLRLAIQLVEKLPTEDVEDGQIQLAALSFGREPRLEAEWAERMGKADFQRRLRSIQPSKVQSSFAAVANKIRQINVNRRPSSRLLIFVFWSGSNGRNTADELSQAVRPFGALPRTELFAISVNPSAQLERLKKLAGGDQWHVFLDARTKQFVDQASRILLDCVLPPSGEFQRKLQQSEGNEDSQSIGEEHSLVPDHEPISSVERVEHLQLAAKAFQRKSTTECKNDPIDLTILLHSEREKTSPEQFDALKRAAMDALRQAPAEHFHRRIRLSIWAGSQQIMSSQIGTKLDDALFTLDRLDSEHYGKGGGGDFVDLLSGIMAQMEQTKREKARMALIILTDGIGEVRKEATIKLAKHRPKMSIFILNFGPKSMEEELGTLFGVNSSQRSPALFRLFTAKVQGQMARFVDEFRRRIIWCRDGKLAMADSVLTNERKRTRAANRLSGIFIEEKAENETIAIPTLPPLNGILEHQNGSKLAGNECKVDLILIIDTSQSVAEEFQQQLQFAIELVRRLPDDDFGQRVQVGVVSFHRIGRIQFAMGELKEKKSVLSALSSIQHTGGSTSVVSGINLAVEEVAKRRRKDARLMMVLVSDGNSQDPWAEVLAAAAKLRAIQADVYAVTVSHDYFFRELEMYAGNKWFVYIDARIRQFLDEAEMSLIECRSPSVPATTTPINDLLSNGTSSIFISPISSPGPSSFTTIPSIPSTLPNTKLEEILGYCRSDPVDLMFILDTSTSVERDFYAQKIFALDLIRVLPERDFSKRLSIGLIKFHSKASLQFPFLVGRRRDDVLYELERIEHTGGQTSLVAGVELALAEIGRAHRPNARLIVVLISDGNSQDEWAKVQETARKLRNETDGELYAVTLSEKYALEELLEYTKDEARIYRDKGIERFLKDVGHSVAACPERELPLTPVPIVEASPTPAPADLLIPNLNLTKLLLADGIRAKNLAGRRVNLRGSRIANSSRELLPQTEEDGTILLLGEQLDEDGEDEETEKCRYTKMDLIIILDASTSRETVFEHQRELALSLIERLPINRQNTHVATGINSFTNVPVLRQTLGLGRDRKMVRKAIEDIKYRGGSTLTSKAVELAIQDLERGRRADALQVVILMNDGMSQDPWEKVLSASKKLAQTGAHRFGVALGDEVDLRELKNYIGDDQRIYRDGSTERFLQDVVSLLNGTEEECAKRHRTNGFGLIAHDEAALLQFQEDSNGCQRPKLDLLILLDNTDASQDGNDPKLNANRYLLLDVLGSLPLGHRVQMAVLSIGAHRLEYQFSDEQQREPIFRHIEQIRPTKGRPNYAKAIGVGVDYLATNRRAGARGMILLVGDGRNTADTAEERAKASALLKRTPGLSCHAVDSSKTVDEQTLTAYTGSSQQIYAYDRNAEFAHFLLAQAMGPSGECHSTTRQQRGQQQQLAHSLDEGRQKDIARAGGDEKLFGGEEKLLVKVKPNEGKKEEKLEGKEVEEERLVARLRSEYRQNIGETDKKVSTTLSSTARPILDGKNSQNNLQRKGRIQGELEAKTTRQSLNGINQSETADQTLTTKRSNQRIRQNARGSRIRPTNSSQNIINAPISSSPTPPFRTSTLTSTKSTSSLAKSTKTLASVSSISPSPSSQSRQSTFRPGCLLDVLLLIDSSGSVEQSFEREKQLAAEILEKLRIGPDNARIALIKFAAADKVRTVHSFGEEQTKERLLAELEAIQFSDGITAIHSALQQAIAEYSPSRGARPGVAQPLALIFTDGFGMQDFGAEANQLRRILSNQVYAIAVDNDAKMPTAREELVRISGDQKRVFTERNLDELFGKQLRDLLRGC